MNERFDVEYFSVATGEDVRQSWITLAQAQALLRSMGNGDDLIIHRTDDDAQPGHLY